MKIKTKNYFDNIVIGSSPLMLLVAINLAKKGFSVILIEKNKNFGGCWQTHLEKNFKYEKASHLIEKYPGVYNILQEYSSIRFIPLKNKPKRIFRNGLITPYQNKLILILTFLKLIIGFFFYSWNFLVFKTKLEQKINYGIKLKDFIKFRSKTFFENNVLYGPDNGYAELIEGLLKNCKKQKVFLKTQEVIKIENLNDQWIVKLSNQEYFICEQLHTTSAINLKVISPKVLNIFKTSFYKKKSALIRIEKKNILNNQSYVSFIGDHYVSRIHRIDQKKKSKKYIYFLVEIKNNKNHKSKKLKQLIGDRLLKSKVIFDESKFNIIKIFYSKYTRNSDQLSIKGIRNFKSYYSNGNLAAGIHKWLCETNQIKDFI